MADQLYLSYWLNSFSEFSMFRPYEKILKLFPYSKLSKSDATFRVVPVSYAEPSVFEQAFKLPVDASAILTSAKEFQNGDCCYRLETEWDLWQYDGSWKLGPQFEEDLGENLRIEFGIDTHFLPQPDLPDNFYMTQSNIKSLLKLVHDLDDGLSVSKRLLWTESGENFAEKLQEALSEART